MTERRWHPTLLTVSTLLPLLALAACSRAAVATPASMPVAAAAARPKAEPAPLPARSTPAPSPIVRAALPDKPAARPSPKEFAASDALKDIHFDFDKSDIRAEDRRRLDADADWMKANGKTLVLVEGHADERGTNEYNLALGDRRARATMNYLVSRGVAATRLTVVSYGEERPLCAEHQESCWSKNRRAHFLVKPE